MELPRASEEGLQDVPPKYPDNLGPCRLSALPSRTIVIDRVLKSILTLALLGELAVLFFNILSRWLFNRPWLWSLEAAGLALSVIAFLGGALAYRRGEHAFVRMLVEALPLGWRRACYTLVELIVLTVAIAGAVSVLPFLASGWEEFTPILGMRLMWLGLPLIAGMIVLAATAVERLVAQHRPTVVRVASIFLAVLLLLTTTQRRWAPWVTSEAALAGALGLFFSTVLIGVPVAFALLLGTLAYLYATDTIPLVALPHNMVNGTGNFVLLAIPFFILVGIVMTKGGISLRLVRLVQTLVGHFRGGLLQVMVVSMYIVSGLSGSKAADVAAVGSVMRDMLRREGYPLEQATAVLAASAAMGETVPPSIAMLVLGSVTTLSIGALFIAGLIPAAVVAICLMVLIYVQTFRRTVHRSPRATLPELARAGLHGILPLLMPLILFGGILLGVAAPTEVSSFAVVYGLVLAGLIYRELGWREFLRGAIDCAATSGMILFILASATSFAWMLTIAHLPQRLVAVLTSGSQSHWMFMLSSIAILILAGSILEGLPALVILAPILMPIAFQIGVNQLHYGIVLVIAMGIGAFIPPVGVGFYTTCAVCETTIEESARAMIPFFVVLCLSLMAVALVPWFTLFLPMTFHMGG